MTTPNASSRGSRCRLELEGTEGRRAGWRSTALLLLLALGVRAAYWAFAVPHYAAPSDAGQYSELAWNLQHGHGLAMRFPQLAIHPSAFRPPVYPLVLALWERIFGASVGAGQALSLVLGLAVVVLAQRFTEKL